MFFQNDVFSLERPKLKSSVNDYANILSPPIKKKVEQLIASHKQETTNNIVVLIIDSLKGEDLNKFSQDVIQSWKPVQKDKDNNILLVIAIKDKKLKIEVGNDLEDDFENVHASYVINKFIKPSFQDENYEEGIYKGIQEIIAIINGDRQNFENDTPIFIKFIQNVFLWFIVGLLSAILIVAPIFIFIAFYLFYLLSALKRKWLTYVILMLPNGILIFFGIAGLPILGILGLLNIIGWPIAIVLFKKPQLKKKAENFYDIIESHFPF